MFLSYLHYLNYDFERHNSQDLFAPFATPAPDTGSFITIVTAVVSPLSRGSVTLASLDPFEFPLIDPALLEHPFDQAAIIRALRGAQGFLSGGGGIGGTGVEGSQWDDGFIIEPILNLTDVRNQTQFSLNGPPMSPVEAMQREADDLKLLNYAQENTQTIWHPVGTARMSPQNATWGVVDSRLRVKKVKGVRVVDASVFVSTLLCQSDYIEIS